MRFRHETVDEVLARRPFKRDVVVSDDGSVRLVGRGVGRERQNYFRYEDKETSFELIASRYYPDLDQGTDQWVVLLGLAVRNSPTGRLFGRDKVREIARNLDAALRVWPRYLNEPVTRSVKFDMTAWPDWKPGDEEFP
jgi:hypothetical protein